MDSPLRKNNIFNKKQLQQLCSMNIGVFVLFTTCSQRTGPNLGLTPPNISERDQTLFLPMRMRFAPQTIFCKHINQSNTLYSQCFLNQNTLLSLKHTAQQEAFRALVLCVVQQLDLSSAAENLRIEGTTSHEHKRNKLCFCKSRSGSPQERQRRAER